MCYNLYSDMIIILNEIDKNNESLVRKWLYIPYYLYYVNVCILILTIYTLLIQIGGGFNSNTTYINDSSKKMEVKENVVELAEDSSSIKPEKMSDNNKTSFNLPPWR